MHLDLRAGEVLGLVGENGAGKSTLMKLLSGIYTADEGEFFLNGERYEPTSPKHALELGISIIHQEFNLMPDLTVAQNLFIGREPAGAGIFTSERAAERAGARADRAAAPPAARRRTSSATSRSPSSRWWRSARRCPTTPKLLIMDEPTAALNDAEVEVLHELIRRFVAPDTGVIYISHRMDELRRIADRITVIRDGRYVGTRETAATTDAGGHRDDGRPRARGRGASRSACARTARWCSRSPGCSTKDLLDDVSFELRKGEILGFAGLMGAGPDRGRARGRRRGQDRRRDDPAARPRDQGRTTRPRRRGTGSATCPRTASSSACCSSRRSTRTSA